MKSAGNRIVFLVASSLVIALICSFATSFNLITSVDTKATTIAVDNFGNYYLAESNKVSKYSPDGKFLYPYEEFKYSKIGSIDVTNPMKLLVYYPDFMTAVTTDRFLSPLNVYNFFQLGYQNVSAIASAADGRIWFYDNVEFKLKKIDEAGNLIRESQPLNIILDKVPNPNFMVERDNMVYMNDPALGILVFDIFGAYVKTIPLKNLSKFQVLQEQLVYFEEKQLRSYNPKTFEMKSLNLPDTTGVTQAVLEKERMGVLKNGKAEFYRY